MKCERILIPLDGTEFSEKALQYLPIVADPQTKIHLISVVPEPVVEALSLSPELWPSTSQEVTIRKGYLKELADKLVREGYTVHYEVVSGAVVDSLVKASGQGFDLIITASHHRTGIGKFILGSVAEGILHHTHCPMLIV